MMQLSGKRPFCETAGVAGENLGVSVGPLVQAAMGKTSCERWPRRCRVLPQNFSVSFGLAPLSLGKCRFCEEAKASTHVSVLPPLSCRMKKAMAAAQVI